MKNVKQVLGIAVCALVLGGMVSCGSDDDGVDQAVACERQAQAVEAASQELTRNPTRANCARFNEEVERFNELGCGSSRGIMDCDDFLQ